MGNTGQDAHPKNTGYYFIIIGWISLKLICGHMFIKFLIFRYFRHKIYDIVWLEQLFYFYTKRGVVPVYGQNAHRLGQNAHSWVCRLTQWSILSIIITYYNNSISIKITIWHPLDNIVVYWTTPLRVVCVISIISYRYITVFFKYITCLRSNNYKCALFVTQLILYKI